MLVQLATGALLAGLPRLRLPTAVEIAEQIVKHGVNCVAGRATVNSLPAIFSAARLSRCICTVRARRDSKSKYNFSLVEKSLTTL
jgi:hypothetical protein